jgi:ABC-type lipoprotein release transport system permease subunit
VLPAAASAVDLAAYLALAALQDLAWLPGAVNELRLFLRPGFRADEAAAALVALPPGAALVRTGRGQVADREAPQALDRLRRLGSAVAGAVAVLALLLAAHLDASERRGELAALVALGGTGATVLASVLARSSLTAAAGAAAGVIAGAAAAWLQDPARAWALGDALPAVAVALAAAVALGAVAALPAAARAARRDPVADLE